MLAHRVAYMLAHGKWPDPFACHHCDNPACCRPDHLFEGGYRENMGDMAKKMRSGRLKLTKAQAQDIRLRYVPRWLPGHTTQDSLAKEFGVSQTTISYVLRTGWKHLQVQAAEPSPPRRHTTPA